MGTSNSKKKYLFEKPWRKQKVLEGGWKKDVQDTLLRRIKDLLNEKTINVVFFGPISSGKSSLINSFGSIGANRITCKSSTGTEGTSHTLHLLRINKINGFENIMFYDTMGVEEGDDNGLSPTVAKLVSEGAVQPNQMLKNIGEEATDKEAKDKEATKKVNNDAKMNCVVYVLDAENIKNGLKEDHKKKIDEIVYNLKQIERGPNRAVILTHIDCICPEVKKDLTTVFESRAVYEVVKDASTTTGVQSGHIFPVKNYVDEQDVSDTTNILLLLALEKIVCFSIDQKGDEPPVPT